MPLLIASTSSGLYVVGNSFTHVTRTLNVNEDRVMLVVSVYGRNNCGIRLLVALHRTSALIKRFAAAIFRYLPGWLLLLVQAIPLVNLRGIIARF